MNEEQPKPFHGDPNIAVTTVESNPDKANVKPYEATPLVELREGSIACAFCGNNVFRRSRVRFHDLRELSFLRYPVRCTRCSQRQYQDFVIGRLALPPKTHGPRLATGNETWSSWTQQDPDVPTSVRPMTTAMGPRAQRLAPPISPAPAAAPPRNIPSRKSNEDNGIW